MLQEGDTAPYFSLPDQDGHMVTLDDVAGKWLVLYFYPKDNTSGCTTEACDFTGALADFQSIGADVIGVSPDSPGSHARFIAKQNLGITLLSDQEKEILRAYGAWGKKKNYGKEYEGVIRTTVLIAPDRTIARLWSNVRVRVKRKTGEIRHVDSVRQALEELKQS